MIDQTGLAIRKCIEIVSPSVSPSVEELSKTSAYLVAALLTTGFWNKRAR